MARPKATQLKMIDERGAYQLYTTLGIKSNKAC
jgi:hypothetical protein